MQVKPVLRLIENRRPLTLEHLPGDFLAAVSGQAVQHYSMRGCTFQKL